MPLINQAKLLQLYTLTNNASSLFLIYIELRFTFRDVMNRSPTSVSTLPFPLKEAGNILLFHLQFITLNFSAIQTRPKLNAVEMACENK